MLNRSVQGIKKILKYERGLNYMKTLQEKQTYFNAIWSKFIFPIIKYIWIVLFSHQTTSSSIIKLNEEINNNECK